MKIKNRQGFIYALFEHQTKSDCMMAFRLMEYMLNICDAYLKACPKAKKLPLIYPVVIYSGTAGYTAPRSLWELFQYSDLVKKLWTEEHDVISIHGISDDKLLERIMSGMVTFFMKRSNDKGFTNIKKSSTPICIEWRMTKLAQTC